MELLPYQQRMIQEHSELNTKLISLSKFFESKPFIDLPDNEKSLLRKQYGYMQRYAKVLNERIMNFNN
jgi:hypothetical protein